MQDRYHACWGAFKERSIPSVSTVIRYPIKISIKSLNQFSVISILVSKLLYDGLAIGYWIVLKQYSLPRKFLPVSSCPIRYLEVVRLFLWLKTKRIGGRKQE